MNRMLFRRYTKYKWALCLFVLVVVYLLMKIHKANVHSTQKKDYASLLKRRLDTINMMAHSRSTYFDVSNRSREKVDWHDYQFIEYEAKREGLGEQGKAAVLSRVDEILRKAIYHANGYNGYLSDQISLNRSLSDTRHPK
jgi:hypothetical protein